MNWKVDLYTEVSLSPEARAIKTYWPGKRLNTPNCTCSHCNMLLWIMKLCNFKLSCFIYCCPRAVFFFFCLIPSWSGVCEETAEAVSGSQPADQHQRTEGRVHSPPPELLTQPPGKRRGSGEQCSAQHTGPESQQSYWGTNKQLENHWKHWFWCQCSVWKLIWMFEGACNSTGFIEVDPHHSVFIW